MSTLSPHKNQCSTATNTQRFGETPKNACINSLKCPSLENYKGFLSITHRIRLNVAEIVAIAGDPMCPGIEENTAGQGALPGMAIRERSLPSSLNVTGCEHEH
jgi:hypothetical protein